MSKTVADAFRAGKLSPAAVALYRRITKAPKPKPKGKR